MWHLYIIRTRLNTLYTGVTTDVKRRFQEHCEQGPKCAKYLRGKAPLALVYTQAMPDKESAYRLEYRIKRLNRADKEIYINSATQTKC